MALTSTHTEQLPRVVLRVGLRGAFTEQKADAENKNANVLR